MIHEDKVILMTKMQAYEDGPGGENIAITKYFRGDYIGRQVLLSIIASIIILLIVIATGILYDVEGFMNNLYQIDVVEFVRGIAYKYVIYTALFCLATYVVYAYRYNKARKKLKKYYIALKQMSAVYAKQDGKL